MAEGLAGVGDLMPRHDYRCPDHRKFEVMVSVKDAVPTEMPCPMMLYEADDELEIIPETAERCGKVSPWVPPTVSFPGGPTTGAEARGRRDD